MSRFNKYARKADEIAKAAFDEYRKTEAAYKKAEEQARQYPQRNGVPVDAEYLAKSARAQADLIEAREAFRHAKRVFADHASEFRTIRRELASEIDEAYRADPAQLDGNTLELLKSGILNGREYNHLLEQAKAAGNPTMARLIGKYAGDAAKARGQKYGADDREVREMLIAEVNSRFFTGEDRLQAFDNMTEIYNRCVNNPGMIDHWSELTAETVDSF
jgi:hypothetical protein